MINVVFFDLPDLHMFLKTLPKQMVFPYIAAKKVSIAYSNNFLALFEPPGSFLSWIPGIQKSRSALELAILDPFQGMGHYSHSIFVKELDFQCKIQIFYQSWKLPEIFWNSGYHLEMDHFRPISTYCVSIQLYFCR